MLGLKQELDFVLATELVFGDDLEQWSALVQKLKIVSGSSGSNKKIKKEKKTKK